MQNVAKEKKGGFLSMLLGTLGAILLGSLLTGRGVKRSKEKKGGFLSMLLKSAL